MLEEVRGRGVLGWHVSSFRVDAAETNEAELGLTEDWPGERRVWMTFGFEDMGSVPELMLGGPMSLWKMKTLDERMGLGGCLAVWEVS